MDIKNNQRFFIRSTVWAIVFSMAALLLPLTFAGGIDFLGKDISSLASGVMQFYPEIAVAEGLRAVATMWLASFFVICLSRAAAQRIRVKQRASLFHRRSRAPLLFFPLLPLLAYLLWLAASVLQYPALYESFLPAVVQTSIWRAAHYVSPNLLMILSLAILLGGPCYALVSGWRETRPRRVSFILAVCLTALLVSIISWLNHASSLPWSAKSQVVDSREHPPIILIGIDSLRFDRVHDREQGSTRTANANEAMVSELTPTLQAWLNEPEVVSFQDHQIGVPRTFPSWIEMLTGRQAPENGVRHMFPGFSARQAPFPSMASVLRESGYETHVISDFAGDIFPRFEAGFSHVDAPNLTLATMIRLSIDQAVPLALPLMTSAWGHAFFPALKESPAFGDPAHLVRKAQRVIRERSAPLFLTLFFSTAHFPYAAPHPFYRSFANPLYRGPYFFQKNPELKVADGKLSEDDVTQVRALYNGAVRAVDAQLAVLFQQLKAANLYDRSIIVVTADHGEDLFETGRLQGHGEHLRGNNVLRVPFLLKLPKGQTVIRSRPDFLSRSIDLSATVLGAAGLAKNVGEGVNLLPYVVSDVPVPRLSSYAETGIWFAAGGQGFFQQQRMAYPGISGLLSFDQGYSGEIVLNQNFERIVSTAKHRSLTKGDYKLIYIPTDQGVEYELYNRYQDPNNEKNLARAHPEILWTMQSDLRTLVRKMEPNALLLGDYVVPAL